MKKLLVFDMDGTIADLYKVDGWLEHLRAESTLPYRVANAMYNMEEMRKVLEILKAKGWRVAVTTWTAMNSTETYSKAVAKEKIEWLKRFKFPYDELHIVDYGTPKHEITKAETQILFDDNDEVRQEWKAIHQIAINANENILDILKLMAV